MGVREKLRAHRLYDKSKVPMRMCILGACIYVEREIHYCIGPPNIKSSSLEIPFQKRYYISSNLILSLRVSL